MSFLSSTVRTKRKRMGLTQDALSKLTGIAQGTISKIENGKLKDPALSIALKLRRVLKFEFKEK